VKTRITRIRDYAAAWGIPVLSRRPRSDTSFSEGPGPWSIATWQRNPRIFAHGIESPKVCKILWPYLLHELAHVVAPVHPTDSNEFLDTLGFEILSLPVLGLPHEEYTLWFSQTWGVLKSDDTIDAIPALVDSLGRTWIQVKPEIRARVEENACALAIERDLFDAEWMPTYRIARRLRQGASEART